MSFSFWLIHRDDVCRRLTALEHRILRQRLVREKTLRAWILYSDLERLYRLA